MPLADKSFKSLEVPLQFCIFFSNLLKKLSHLSRTVLQNQDVADWIL